MQSEIIWHWYGDNGSLPITGKLLQASNRISLASSSDKPDSIEEFSCVSNAAPKPWALMTRANKNAKNVLEFLTNRASTHSGIQVLDQPKALEFQLPGSGLSRGVGKFWAHSLKNVHGWGGLKPLKTVQITAFQDYVDWAERICHGII